MYAVVKTGGKQYIATPGEVIRIEKLDGKVGDEVVFTDVLMFKDGEKMLIGQPLVQDAKVTGKIVQQDRAKKVISFKRRAKKGYKRKIGHRQYFTDIKVENITVAG
ncbi:MAG: 50S ribosomal protein L21 [Elusimicrobiota bacterium]